MVAATIIRRGSVELDRCPRPAPHRPHFLNPAGDRHHRLCPGIDQPSGPHVDHVAEKQRSYLVHEQVAAALGRPKAAGYSPRQGEVLWLVADRDVLRQGRAVVLAGDLVRLVSTSNAGFRGIECAVRDGAGTVHHGISLGAFHLPAWPTAAYRL
jgi:hypothetical protein